MRPWPQGEPLTSVWGSSDQNLYFGLQSRDVLRWDGGSWALHLGQHADSMWGSADGPLWVVSRAQNQYYQTTGSGWANSPTPSGMTLEGVWGAGTNDVWIYGGTADGGMAALHDDGGTIALLPFGTAGFAVGMTGAPGDLFIASSDGSVVHTDGGSIERHVLEGVDRLDAIWSSANDDVWAVGAGAVHLDGASWKTWISSDAGVRYSSVSGTGSTDAWLAGTRTVLTPSSFSVSYVLQHFDGVGLTQVQFPWGSPTGLQALAQDDVWGASSAGPFRIQNGAVTLLSRELVNWVTGVHSGVPESTGVWLGAGPEMFIAGAGVVNRWDGAHWTTLPIHMGASTVAVLGRLWGTSAEDLWGLDRYSEPHLVHWDGSAWKDVGQPFSGGRNYGVGLWGAASDDLWMVDGAGQVVRWTGTELRVETTLPLLGTATDLYGSAPGDLWVVTDQGESFHRESTGTWTQQQTGTTLALTSVWSSGPDDAWAVGLGNTLLHWDGATWSQTGSLPDYVFDDWYSVRGTGASDVWLSGANGMVMHWNGTSWAPGSYLPSKGALTAIAPNANEVWVVGTNGALRSPR